MDSHPTARLARFCAHLHGPDIPETVRTRVRYLLLDQLAVTIRGSMLPSSQATYHLLESMAAYSRSGVTILGREERAEAAWAALANGVAAHGLEMDDVENRSSLHPGVVVFPAALALAEQLGTYATPRLHWMNTTRLNGVPRPGESWMMGEHTARIAVMPSVIPITP